MNNFSCNFVQVVIQKYRGRKLKWKLLRNFEIREFGTAGEKERPGTQTIQVKLFNIKQTRVTTVPSGKRGDMVK
jgi:hypothetical protein